MDFISVSQPPGARRLLGVERAERVMRNIGRRVLELRRERGWTQEHAAERMRLDVVALRRIEGGRQLVTLRTLVRLANALGVPTRALFDEAQLREARRPGRPPSERAVAEPRGRRAK